MLLALAALAVPTLAAAVGPSLQMPTPKVVRPGVPAPPPRAADEPLLSPRRVDAVKVVVATATAILLAWGAAAGPDPRRRLRDALLVVLGVLGAACWVNLGRFHHPHFLHRADNFLYFVGAKYFAELGYDGLYRCTAVADAEAGLGERVARRSVRNLETNRLEPASGMLAEPERCKRHFSEARWNAFRRDVAWFRTRTPPRRWSQMQIDHGYNATPVWGIAAITLANTGPASGGRILALALLDPLLLLAMGGCVWWAFGWRTLCIALVFFGTNYFAQFGWTGGAFLRHDWLAASIAGICLLRRGRPAAGGFLLVLAAGLRLFPALLLAGVALKALVSMARARRLVLEPGHLRLALGGALALALLLPLSLAVAGTDAWPGFVRNSRLHLDTPLQNHAGLATVLAYHPERTARLLKDTTYDDPYEPWKRARRETFAGRRALFAGLVAGYAALLAWAVAGRPDWVATTLAIGLVPVAGELTSYYWALLLGYALLWTRHPGVGVALCAFSALSWGIVEERHFYDEIFVGISVAAVALVLYVTLAVGRAPRSDPA